MLFLTLSGYLFISGALVCISQVTANGTSSDLNSAQLNSIQFNSILIENAVHLLIKATLKVK